MISEVIASARAFAKSHNFTFVAYRFKKRNLWGRIDPDESANWAKFEQDPGVYIFASQDRILYVGKSISNTGGRLFTQFQDRVKRKSFTEETEVAVLSFSKDKHFTSALESYLIEQFQPKLNRKLG